MKIIKFYRQLEDRFIKYVCIILITYKKVAFYNINSTISAILQREY